MNDYLLDIIHEQNKVQKSMLATLEAMSAELNLLENDLKEAKKEKKDKKNKKDCSDEVKELTEKLRALSAAARIVADAYLDAGEDLITDPPFSTLVEDMLSFCD